MGKRLKTTVEHELLCHLTCSEWLSHREQLKPTNESSRKKWLILETAHYLNTFLGSHDLSERKIWHVSNTQYFYSEKATPLNGIVQAHLEMNKWSSPVKAVAFVDVSHHGSYMQHLPQSWYEQQHFNITVFNTRLKQNMLALYMDEYQLLWSSKV